MKYLISEKNYVGFSIEFGSFWIRFLDPVPGSGSWIRFQDPVPGSGSLIRFLDLAPGSGSWIRFLDPVPGSGSWLLKKADSDQPDWRIQAMINSNHFRELLILINSAND